MKVCAKHPELAGARYLSGVCKACQRERNAAYYATHKESEQTRHKAYAARNPDAYRLTKACCRNHFTSAGYRETLAKQKGLCALCGTKLAKPRADHCHATKTPRGILCNACNVGLHYVERPGWVSKARRYLRYHATKRKQ